MPKEKVAYRRLYDSLGCSLAQRDDFEFRFTMGELHIEVHFGPKPRLGITVSHTEKYFVPGESALMVKGEYSRDATESKYPRRFFTEIVCSKQIDVAASLSEAFHAKHPDAHGELLRIAERHAKEFSSAADLVAVTIGLRSHRQFVMEVINENFAAFRSDSDFAFSEAGPAIETLEGVALNITGMQIMKDLFDDVGRQHRSLFSSVRPRWCGSCGRGMRGITSPGSCRCSFPSRSFSPE